jgi:hypothetical protein
MIEKRKQCCVLQDWVIGLGLRYQGVLLTVIRGCDTISKENPCKYLARAIRGLILNTHCADPRKSVSFIESVEHEVLEARYRAVLTDYDAYPMHYLLHLIHATEILGYHHPDPNMRGVCYQAYKSFCRKFHMGMETQYGLQQRLEADEEAFGQLQRE